MSEDKKPIIEVHDLGVGTGSDSILKNISFTIYHGDVLAIIGPNGAGKSTLFRALLGLVPYRGQVTWSAEAKIGYVPQKLFIENSFPLTVAEFLGFKSSSRKSIVDALESVGIQHPHTIMRQKLGVLSGGELQRVLIAWSIIDNPNVLLFDEPTAGIDIGGEETIYNLLHELQDKRDLTILLISHDLNVVYRYATNVLCINKQQICFGEPSTVLEPQNLSVLYGGEARFYHHQHPHGDH